jgi:hypothetical protein
LPLHIFPGFSFHPRGSSCPPSPSHLSTVTLFANVVSSSSLPLARSLSPLPFLVAPARVLARGSPYPPRFGDSLPCFFRILHAQCLSLFPSRSASGAAAERDCDGDGTQSMCGLPSPSATWDHRSAARLRSPFLNYDRSDGSDPLRADKASRFLIRLASVSD